MTPPTGGVFEPEVYENATLVIPEDAEPAYRAAAGWRNFFDTITGDVDNDGVVDVADINLLINIMLHHSEATANSDVNNDGEIDVADINMVVLIMLSE